MADLITEVGRIVTAAFGANGWVASIIDCVTANPILYIGFILSIAGFGIGAIKRLSRLG